VVHILASTFYRIQVESAEVGYYAIHSEQLLTQFYTRPINDRRIIMKAHEIMISQVYKVKETDMVRSVVEKFIEHRISGLPVVNDRNEIVAYVSDGDIMRYIGKHKDLIVDIIYFSAMIKVDKEDFDERVQRLLNLNILKIAKRKVIKVSWDEEVEDVAAVLGNKQIKKLPVERDGVLVGIISRGDIIRHSFKNYIT
jgi:CBS domain-containing protein